MGHAWFHSFLDSEGSRVPRGDNTFPFVGWWAQIRELAFPAGRRETDLY